MVKRLLWTSLAAFGLGLALGPGSLAGCQLFSLSSACGPDGGECIQPACNPDSGDCQPDSGPVACTTTVSNSQFSVCDGGADTCPTGLDCVIDAELDGGTFDCEYPCNSATDCPGAGTICKGNNCIQNLCDNTQLDSVCNAAGTDDGTCEPLDDDGGIALNGVCFQGGTIDNRKQPCNFPARCPGDDLCAPGWLCYVNGGDTTGTCTQLCDPLVDGGSCATGTTCSSAFGSQDYGNCLPVTDGG